MTGRAFRSLGNYTSFISPNVRFWNSWRKRITATPANPRSSGRRPLNHCACLCIEQTAVGEWEGANRERVVSFRSLTQFVHIYCFLSQYLDFWTLWLRQRVDEIIWNCSTRLVCCIISTRAKPEFTVWLDRLRARNDGRGRYHAGRSVAGVNVMGGGRGQSREGRLAVGRMSPPCRPLAFTNYEYVDGFSALFHDLFSPPIPQNCVWSVITAHNLTRDKR